MSPPPTEVVWGAPTKRHERSEDGDSPNSQAPPAKRAEPQALPAKRVEAIPPSKEALYFSNWLECPISGKWTLPTKSGDGHTVIRIRERATGAVIDIHCRNAAEERKMALIAMSELRL